MIKTLRKNVRRSGRIVAVDLSTAKAGYNFHFNRSKDGSLVRLTTPRGAKFYFTKADITALSTALADLAKP